MLNDPNWRPEAGGPAADKDGKKDRIYPPRLSEVFTGLALEADEPVSVMRIRAALGDRSFAALLVFFACLNLLPLPPGTTLVLGLPLIIVSAQMVWGAETVWLPRVILSKSVRAEQFRQMTDRLIPWLTWLERYVRPRWWPMPDRYDERAIGAAALLLGTLVTLPIPFGNWFPALTIALAGLALVQRDGLLLGAATLCGLFSIGLIVALYETVAHAATFFAGSFF